jgi:acyl carrier protein
MDAELEIIADYIRREMAYEGDIAPDVDLLDEQILDSFSIVQVAMFIQDRFGIELEAEDLNRENLASLNSMLSLVNSRRSK